MPVLNCMALRLPPSVSLTVSCIKSDQNIRKDSFGTESTNTDNTPLPKSGLLNDFESLN